MKTMFWIGLAALILGIVPLLIPIPSSQREGIRVGSVSIGIDGIEARHHEKLSPLVSAAMILGGAGMMIAQKVKA